MNLKPKNIKIIMGANKVTKIVATHSGQWELWAVEKIECFNGSEQCETPDEIEILVWELLEALETGKTITDALNSKTVLLDDQAELHLSVDSHSRLKIMDKKYECSLIQHLLSEPPLLLRLFSSLSGPQIIGSYVK